MKPATVLLTEYGCVLCQKWHRKGIDPEYQPHLMRQSKHGPRSRVATAAETFLLELRRAEDSAAR